MKICRGLVTTEDGEIVARPFPKFFNLSDKKRPNPTQDYDIYEKMDGSLGILFNYKGEWIITTCGTFDTPQAIEGQKMLHSLDKLDQNLTYLFEIIYPGNKIVVNYHGAKRLVYLSAFQKDGIERSDIRDTMIELGYEVVEKVPITFEKTENVYEDLEKFRQQQIANKEGYVVVFSDGSRVKVKFDIYFDQHKNVDSRFDMLTHMKKKESLETIIQKHPHIAEQDIVTEYTQIKAKVDHIMGIVDKILSEFTDLDKGAFAKAIKDQPKHMKPMLFERRLDHDITNLIFQSFDKFDVDVTIVEPIAEPIVES